MRGVETQDAVLSALGTGAPLRHGQAVIDGVGHIVRVMQLTGVRLRQLDDATFVRKAPRRMR